jgi:hypothetical protein
VVEVQDRRIQREGLERDERVVMLRWLLGRVVGGFDSLTLF